LLNGLISSFTTLERISERPPRAGLSVYADDQAWPIMLQRMIPFMAQAV
jgi:hypothetical protein